MEDGKFKPDPVVDWFWTLLKIAVLSGILIRVVFDVIKFVRAGW